MPTERFQFPGAEGQQLAASLELPEREPHGVDFYEHDEAAALFAAIEARMNSVIRNVGVPSMQLCSPRKPDRPFSYTITERVLEIDEWGFVG